MDHDEWVRQNYPRVLEGVEGRQPFLLDTEKLRKVEIEKRELKRRQQEADRSCGCVSTPSVSSECSHCSSSQVSSSCGSCCECSVTTSSPTTSSSPSVTISSPDCNVCQNQTSLCSCSDRTSPSGNTNSRVSSVGVDGSAFPFLLNASISSHGTQVPAFRSRWRKSPSSSSSFQPSTPTVTSYSTPAGSQSSGWRAPRGSLTSYTRTTEETIAISSQRSSDLAASAADEEAQLEIISSPKPSSNQQTIAQPAVMTSIAVQTDVSQTVVAEASQTDNPIRAAVEVQVSNDDEEFGETDAGNPLSTLITPAEVWSLKESLAAMEVKLRAEETLRKGLQIQLAINFEMWTREELISSEMKCRKKISTRNEKLKRRIVSASSERSLMEGEERITKLTDKIRIAEEKTSDYFDVQEALKRTSEELEVALEKAATADRLRERLDRTEAKMFDCETRREEDLALCHSYETMLKRKMTHLMKLNRENSSIIEQQQQHRQKFQHVDESVESRFARVHREIYIGTADTIKKHPTLVVPNI